MNRKGFLRRLAAASAFLVAGGRGWTYLHGKTQEPSIPGSILGANHKLGHLLRDNPPPPREANLQGETCRVAIVGAGIAGLSAAWHLQKQGIKDLKILEMHSAPGGNSLSGSNGISAYPWGAHYLPLPNPDNELLLSFLSDVKVRLPGNRYDERYLCHSPQERLFIHGRWQDGLIPEFGIPEMDKAQIKTFLTHMDSLRHTVCNDGKEAFSIPLDLSSSEGGYREWDKISMKQWMQTHGYDSPYLQWFANYCTRDDFGLSLGDCSAWAGVHYFAGRKGSGKNAKVNSVLAWPQGNGWLVDRMADRLSQHIQCNALVSRISSTDQGGEVLYLDVPSGKYKHIKADKIIFAGPQFIGNRLIEGYKAAQQGAFTYAPWVVANLSLSQRPGGKGRPLSWDNVAYDSPSLGYVVADHQSLLSHPQQKTVITWYMALSGQSPETARGFALKSDYEHWQDYVLQDLERMHPGIRDLVERLDVWIWGHGMIRPQPGFIWGEARQKAQEAFGNVHFAHSDLSGISIFEEAFFQGHRAAQEIWEGS